VAIATAALPRALSPWGMYASADIVVKIVMAGLAAVSVATSAVWLAKTIEIAGATRRLPVSSRWRWSNRRRSVRSAAFSSRDSTRWLVNGLVALAQHASGVVLLTRWLERDEGYPAAARINRRTGVAQLGFVIDRAGRLVASRIVRSSGFAALDQETLATVRRAEPFPPPPPGMPGERFDFAVPIRFNVR
jgi:TonB family protein